MAMGSPKQHAAESTQIPEIEAEENRIRLDEDSPDAKAARKACEARLVRKLDWIFLPSACISIIMKKIDQTNYRAAYTAGMRDDLDLAGTNVLNWLEIYFTIAFAIFMVPSVLVIMRVRPSIWLPSLEIVWGLLTGCMALASSPKPMYCIRFLIGVCEASAWPGTTVLLLSWYTPTEMAKRQAVYLSASYIGSMVCLAFIPIIHSIHQSLDDRAGLAGWRWLFIINGMMTVLSAGLSFYTIPDYPNTTRARYLRRDEVETAKQRLRDIGKSTQSPTPEPVIPLLIKAARTMFSFEFILLFLAYAPWGWAQQTNAYFNLFLDSLQNDDGTKRYTTTEVTNIPVGAYGISVFSAIFFASLSDRFQMRWQIAIAVNLIQLACTSTLAAWPASDNLKMAALLSSYTTVINEPLIMTWLGETFKAFPTERAVIVAWTVSLLFVGNAAMPLTLWPAREAPNYKYGYKVAVGR
ncbi:Pantothenate transporter-like protein 3 [Elsinoe fawcettii]|nr:Pantothenate transporter-like protein 3 [Elsinoe fawcettii]